MVGDLWLFAAATYLRGISFIQVPTTLFCRWIVNGGRMELIFDAYKNIRRFICRSWLIRIFPMPEDPMDEQFSSGMGEIITWPD